MQGSFSIWFGRVLLLTLAAAPLNASAGSSGASGAFEAASPHAPEEKDLLEILEEDLGDELPTLQPRDDIRKILQCVLEDPKDGDGCGSDSDDSQSAGRARAKEPRKVGFLRYMAEQELQQPNWTLSVRAAVQEEASCAIYKKDSCAISLKTLVAHDANNFGDLELHAERIVDAKVKYMTL